jgi:hypothetical protein
MLTGGSSLFEYPVGTMRYHGGAPSRLAHNFNKCRTRLRGSFVEAIQQRESDSVGCCVSPPETCTGLFASRESKPPIRFWGLSLRF